MQSRIKNVTVCGLALLFLAGAAVDQHTTMVAPQDVGPYLARVKEVTAQLPMRMGDWLGEDVEVPPAAVRLLRPNVIISRKYTNFITGSTANILLIHCADARDLVGHYPPVCYPNQGWIMGSAKPCQWKREGSAVEFAGTEYQFQRSALELSGVTIRNFMLLPDGTTAPDMNGIYRSASTDRHFYGAGEVQIIMNEGMPDEERATVVNAMIEANAPLIDAILAGPRGK